MNLSSTPDLDLQPTPCPALPWEVSARDMARLAQTEAGRNELVDLFLAREELVARAESDPFRFGWEFPPWQDARRLLRSHQLLYISGGKRASKSEFAAKTLVQAALKYPHGKLWAFHEADSSSITMQQALVWKYLPPEIKALEGRRSTVFKLNYSEANGFSGAPRNKLVLPNHTQIHFLVYGQEVKDYQGWSIGGMDRGAAWNADQWPAAFREAARQYQQVDVPNLGAWCDEDMPLVWYETVRYRLSDRSAKLLWTFSTLTGITPTIKEFLGPAKTLEHRPAELLTDRVNVEDCPAGTMPYIQQPATRGAAAIYFFTEANAFSNYAGPGGVRELCAGRPSQFVEMNAYGYARDLKGRMFPHFGAWNISEDVPKEGTDYQFVDPAGARNWSAIWVRVTPGKEPRFHVLGDWPDCGTHGEWAVPSGGGKFDGDAGPAQRPLGLGVAGYRRLFREIEAREGWKPWVRFIDPRAGHNPHADEHGGTCLIDQLATPDEAAEGMEFLPASGVRLDMKLDALRALMAWDKQRPLEPVTNAPKLFIHPRAQQVIWALHNWTGADGEKGACKDFVDVLGMMACAELQHVDATAPRCWVHPGR